MNGESASVRRERLLEWRRLRRTLLKVRVLARLRPNDRQALLVWAAAIGFLGAIAALIFKSAMHGMQWLLTGETGSFLEVFAALPPWKRLAIPAVGGLFAGLVLILGQRFIKRKSTDYMEAIALGDGIVPLRSSLVRSGAALMSIASGAAIGREGPLVQLAALSASLVGRLRSLAPARRRLLVACGAAAGIAAAYNTPLGGALFVAEIILGSLSMESLGPLLIASVVAVLTNRTVAGADPLYPAGEVAVERPVEMLLCVLLGVLCGLAAHGWTRLLQHGKRAFGRIPGPAWVRLALGGILIGVLAAWRPEVTGNGASAIRLITGGELAWTLVGLILVLKILATTAAFGSGAVGGVFTPSLMIGAGGGYLFAHAIVAVWPHGVLEPAAFAYVGMGGFLSAAAGAPVTAILMVFEMTLDYSLVLPLMVVAVAAHVTSRGLRAETLYQESLRTGPRSVFDLPLREVAVRHIMRPQTTVIAPATRFREIAAGLLRNRGSEQWVARAGGEYAGAILLQDVQPFLRDPVVADSVLAADIMREDVPRLTPEMGLPEALGVFSHTRFEHLPVIAPEDDRLVGTLARADLFLAISEITRRDGTREPV